MPIFGHLGRRLLVWFSLIAIVPLAMIGIRGYILARRAVIREVFLHMEAVADHKQIFIEEWLSERASDLDMFACDPLIRGPISTNISTDEPSERLQTASSCLAELGGFDQFSFIDSTDRVLFSTKSRNPVQDIQHPHLWTSVWRKENEVLISPVEYSPALGTMIYMARKLTDSTGSSVGWLVGRLPLSRALDRVLMDSTGLGQSGQAYLVDSEKIMLTRSRLLDHPEPGTHKMSSAAIDSALAGHSGVGIYAGWRGNPVLGAWNYLPHTHWALITEMDRSEALAELEHLKRNWLVVFLLTLASIFIVVAILAKSISKPILSLTHAAEKLSEGDLSVRSGIERKDEVGVLGRAFDHMAETLAKSQFSLKESYQKLLRAERQLVQTEKLAAIGEIVASIVHELRNPLSAIKMNLKILSRKWDADAAASKNLNTAQEQVARLDQMLSGILQYAKPVEIHKTSIFPGELLEEVVEHLSPEIEAKEIKIVWNLEHNLPALKGDRELLIQALTNLIKNAIEAMPSASAGQITLTTVLAHGPEPEIIIEIGDTGIGLSEIQLQRVFEPFYTTRRDGTGLGLPNVKKVIELHQGHLEIFSQQNEGTTARITLPLGEANESNLDH